MAAGKQTGLGDNFYVAGRDISGDISAFDEISGGCDTNEVTGIDKSAIERLGGLRSGTIKAKSFFDAAAGGAHPTFAALPATDVIATYCRGTVVGNPAARIVAKQLGYDPTRDDKANLTADVELTSQGLGLEWCELLTAGKQVDTTGTNGTDLDFGATSTAFGLQAYLHVFALTGTNVVVTLQDSADGSSWSNVTGGAFTSVTSAPAAQRIATANNLTVRRHLRCVSSGTFTSATYAVAVARNLTAVVF